MSVMHVMVVLVMVNGSDLRVFVPEAEYETFHQCNDRVEYSKSNPSNIEMIRDVLELGTTEEIKNIDIICQPGSPYWEA